MNTAAIDLYQFVPYITVLFVVLWFAKPLYPFFTKTKIKWQIHKLADNSTELTPKQFFAMRNKRAGTGGGKGSPKYALSYNFAGVYVLYNKTKDVYYVGQAKQILNRVNNHFTGKGNGDVYADYKYGDKWVIKMIALDKSGFHSLNELERYAIHAYNAYEKGYNKNRGNSK